MNWQSTTTSEVNKEKIWSELVKKEHRELRVFDTYRSSTASMSSGKANTAPVSERQKRFLNKNQLLFESSIHMALPELRQRASSSQGPEGSRYALPLHNMQHRCTVLSPTLSSSSGNYEEQHQLSRKLSSQSLSSTQSMGGLSSGGGSASRSPVAVNSTSPFFRPTSASEIGSMVTPLVKHRVSSYRYSIPRTDIRNAVHQ